ncbi:MAG: 23S rRNA (guanosine(2251)-2'-O)-methyltransferase RlmB [Sphingobacteriales bacterium]|nr:MAG: 23S rRNA (guanosine(2251)-2'-O)-methyltransferase RlmB [Sphingobacteriales bacterium]
MKTFRHQHARPKKNTLVIGREAVIRAMKDGKALEKIFLQANVHGPLVDEIKKLAAENLVPISKVPVEKLNNLNVSNHEGCVAQIAKVQYQDLQQVIDFVVEKGEAPLLLMLDGITDIRNIGGIARSAYAMGVHAIVIPEKGVGALNDDAILTSAGALEHIAVCRVNSLMKAVDELRLNGIKVYATEMKADKNIADCNFTEPCAIIMGSEEKGIYPALLKYADEKCRIPMAGIFDSLNVSVSTGIVLYEAVKQRESR